MKVQKVVWYEGMKLDPHHFQNADKFNQYNLNTRINSLNSNAWGIQELAVDKAALAGGKFGFINCSGVMPDGLVINIPLNDVLPPERSFEDIFSATAERLDVYLAVPLDNSGGINCQINGTVGENPRYTMQKLDLSDYNTGSNIRSIGITKTNFQFRFGDESLDEFSNIKIGEIIRTSDGKYDFEKNYIVPCLSISASEQLMGHVREILGGLVSKSKELRTLAGVHKPELAIVHVEILMMLQSINSFIPLLNYHYKTGAIHPEDLYLLLLNIIGALSTFSNMGVRTEDLPQYDHKHLTEIFDQLAKEIASILNVRKTVERKDINIPLRKQADNLFIGQLSPAHMAGQFYIGVSGNMPESKVIAEFPRNIKISAYEEIFAVHQAGIQGVAVEYTARPPAGFTVNEKTHYFRIIKEGRFWDKIVQKNNIAFFITTEFKSVQMELDLLMP